MLEFPEPARRARPAPDWLVTDPDDYEEYDLGPLKTGKEAEVFLVERIAPDGRSCVLAHKRYRPRRVTEKGELEALGFQRANSFVNDHVYRDGRRFAKTRDQRAAERMTNYGKELLTRRGPGHELDVMTKLWDAGVRVPYPVGPTADGLLMEYIGDRAGAAPRLAQARLERHEVESAAGQLRTGLRLMVAAGFVHGDLSAYNLLWWDGELVVIDLPQAVDITVNPHAFDFLHRDLQNVAAWFVRHGVGFDADTELAELLSVAFGG
ncbi:MAG TPA: RIO1 family regulatory kinase/ATPase [Acidimicrobiales bacterium]|nr:RIO1 family regulatory kinase/ATPase [Acidimicrobiales bacterium]